MKPISNLRDAIVAGLEEAKSEIILGKPVNVEGLIEAAARDFLAKCFIRALADSGVSLEAVRLEALWHAITGDRKFETAESNMTYDYVSKCLTVAPLIYTDMCAKYVGLGRSCNDSEFLSDFAENVLYRYSYETSTSCPQGRYSQVIAALKRELKSKYFNQAKADQGERNASV